MPDKELAPRDIFEPEVLTTLIEERVTEQDSWDIGDIAPIESTRNTRLKVRIRTASNNTLGSFRAENDFSTLIELKERAEEWEINTPLLSERAIIREDVLRRLNSVDPNIALEGAADIVEMGVVLRRRNVNLTRWMFFQSAMDQLVITYRNNTKFAVDWDLNNTDGLLAGSHTPTPSTVWSNPAATVIADIAAWALLIADDAGVSQDELVLVTSQRVFNYLRANTQIQQLFGTVAEPRMPTTTAAVADILGIRSIRQYNALYKDASDVTQRYLPEDRVLLYAPTIDGTRTMRVMDGPVAFYAGNRIQIANNPGARTELWAEAEPPVETIRVQSARMPIIMREGLVCSDVY